MPKTTTDPVRVERVIRASADRVFRAWTDGSLMRKWFAPEGFTIPEATVDARPGGGFRVRMRAPDGSDHVAFGTFRRVEAPRRLEFTWSWESTSPDEPAETRVTVELKEEEGATRVVLVHEGFSSEEERASHEDGWVSCLDRLVGLLEEG